MLAHTSSLIIVLLLSVFSFQIEAQTQANVQNYVPGEMIVKLKGKMSSASSKTFFGKAQSEKSMSLKGSFSAMNLHHYNLKPGQDVMAAIRDIQNDPSVEYAEPNYILKKSNIQTEFIDTVSASDVEALSVDSRGSYGQTAAPIQATDSWSELSTSSTRPIVAIIDSGVETSHPALQNAIWTNKGEIAGNGIDDDGNGYIDDVHGWNFNSQNNDPQDCDGHGTHVAGIVRGVGQNLFQSPSPVSLIEIMPIRFLDCAGNGNTADAIKAVYYAVNNGAHILNNSWGGSYYSNALRDAVAYANQNHVLFVAAAGNAGVNNDSTPSYPSSFDFPTLLSVAATTNADQLAQFSNYGTGSVHMAAPGVSILSSYLNGQFAYLSGTSMATPFVSGAAAMMLHERAELSGYQMKALIEASVNSIVGLESKVATAGRLNVLNSVLLAKSITTLPEEPVGAQKTNSYDRTLASGSNDRAGGCGLVQSVVGNGISGSGISGKGPGGGLIIFLFLSPILVYFLVRTSVQRRDMRTTRRFNLDSNVRVRIGEREVVGAMSDISLGGVSINATERLERGSIMSLTIESPDGKDTVTVQGQIVWSDEKKSYGVRFLEEAANLREFIQNWAGVPAPVGMKS